MDKAFLALSDVNGAVAPHVSSESVSVVAAPLALVKASREPLSPSDAACSSHGVDLAVVEVTDFFDFIALIEGQLAAANVFFEFEGSLFFPLILGLGRRILRQLPKYFLQLRNHWMLENLLNLLGCESFVLWILLGQRLVLRFRLFVCEIVVD